jgi:hypothetical protein
MTYISKTDTAVMVSLAAQNVLLVLVCILRFQRYCLPPALPFDWLLNPEISVSMTILFGCVRMMAMCSGTNAAPT